MKKEIKQINPASDKDAIDKIDLSNKHNFSKFLKSIRFTTFRHIRNLTLNFIHPISVIAGTNRSGKTTILMALACSHFDFKKRNIHNGLLERHTWSDIMQFTKEDDQKTDWEYFITYKIGDKEETKRGQRKSVTKKWNGIGKKESQFKNRQVVFLDLDRVLPARNFGKSIFNKSRQATVTTISKTNILRIEQCLSYILEESFKLNKLVSHLDKDIYIYNNSNKYSSYNAATGEEVLTKIIIDIIEAPDNSLILIDEIEVGLHPKIQRRLIHTLYNISRNDGKQFILTSHSPSIISSLPNQARIFIEKSAEGNFKSIPNISINAALSKMDSLAYSLFDLYCEDEVAEKIIKKAIFSIQSERGLINFSDLINVIVSGAADKTYTYFTSHRETYSKKKIKSGYACILDGDQELRTNKDKSLMYPKEECLHFLYSNEAPEKFLIRMYLEQYPNQTLEYHLANSDSHCLFDKMIENSIAGVSTKEDVFEITWNNFIASPSGKDYFHKLKLFLIKMAKKYSPDL